MIRHTSPQKDTVPGPLCPIWSSVLVEDSALDPRSRRPGRDLPSTGRTGSTEPEVGQDCPAHITSSQPGGCSPVIPLTVASLQFIVNYIVFKSKRNCAIVHWNLKIFRHMAYPRTALGLLAYSQTVTYRQRRPICRRASTKRRDSSVNSAWLDGEICWNSSTSFDKLQGFPRR